MKALTSNYEWKDHKEPLHVATYNLLVQVATAIANPLYPASAFAKLKPDTCSNPNREVELRKHEWVQFYLSLFNTGYEVVKAPLPEGCSDLDTRIILGDWTGGIGEEEEPEDPGEEPGEEAGEEQGG